MGEGGDDWEVLGGDEDEVEDEEGDGDDDEADDALRQRRHAVANAAPRMLLPKRRRG